MKERWRYLLKPCISGSLNGRKKVAERDIRRLKLNWVFVSLLCSMVSIAYVSPLSTIHQFIINPTAEELNKTDERMEPGLQQSETFYSWTLAVFFIGFTISGVVAGILNNWIPYWYLFFSCTLAHVAGYVLYALATNGWMMILGRLFAGISMGFVLTLTFAYYGVSFEAYSDNMKTLEKYEEEKAARAKGYVFSLQAIGTTLGQLLGAGFSTILENFDVAHFRAVGWFNAATGVVLLLLEVAMFRGEWKRSHTEKSITGKTAILRFMRNDQRKLKDFCKYFIPMYMILMGGIKGARYVLAEILVSPILSDSFGFSEAVSAYFFLCYPVGLALGSALVIGIQYLKFDSFFLTVSGLICTITGLLIMTDWQAIPHDPCTNYSLFHHPELADTYRMQLLPAAIMNRLCIPQPVGESVQFLSPEYNSSLCWTLKSDPGLQGSSQSLLAEVHIQSLQVVQSAVYEIAVNRCESFDNCHWIPNSQVTHKHCSDCQPICRSTKHTLNFIQFTIGLCLFFGTLPLMYTGTMLLLSNSVSRNLQGISFGCMVTLTGIVRSTTPLWLDAAYERVQKRTFFPMLILVGLFLPLLIGLLLLYPWIRDGSKKREPLEKQEEDNEETELMSAPSLKHPSDSDQ